MDEGKRSDLIAFPWPYQYPSVFSKEPLLWHPASFLRHNSWGFKLERCGTTSGTRISGFSTFHLLASSPQGEPCENYKSWQPHMGFLAVSPFLFSEKIYTEDPNSPTSVWDLHIYPYCLEAVMAQETIGFWTLNQVEITQISLSQEILLTLLPKHSFVWSQVRKVILSIDLALQMSHLFLLVAFHSLVGTSPMKSTLDSLNLDLLSPYFPTWVPRGLWLPIQLLCLDKIANQFNWSKM